MSITGKIIYVSTLERGGPVTHLRALVGAIVRHGFDVHVLCATDRMARSFQDVGAPASVATVRGKLDLRAVTRLWHDLEGAHIVHSHDRRAGLFARLIGRVRNAQVVHTLHGLPETFTVQPRGTSQAISSSASTPSACDRLRVAVELRLSALGTVVTPSHALGDWLVARGVPVERIEVIGHWLEVRRQQPRPRAGHLVAGVCAQLEPWKGVDVLIDACAHTAQRVQLEVYGDGSERLALERQAARLGVDAHFHGYVSDLSSRLAGLDVVVSPSRTENLPFAVLEAMAHALPVIATRVGGVPELVIDGETGVLVDVADHVALAAALDRLARMPALADAMGRAGAARVGEVYSEARMVPRFEALYRRLMVACPLAADGST